MSLEDISFRPAPQFRRGTLWPVRPGQPAADRCLGVSQADAIVYDALVDPSILSAAREGAQMHFVGKRGGSRESARQDDITALLIHLARENLRVLRLKGGDPYIFGRGGEEAQALARAQIPFRILAGVTSAFGALANVGIPATMRGFNKAIILATGHAVGTDDDLDWAALAKTGQPIVVYMGLKNLPEIAAVLTAVGLAPTTPVAVIMAATPPVERVLVATLSTVPEHDPPDGFVSPSLT